MRISVEQFAKIVEEETANVLKENLLSKMLGSITDLYTRLNVRDRENPEEKGKKEKITKESYDKVTKEFTDYFIANGKPLSQKKEVLATFQATTQAGFSNVVELEEASTTSEGLLKEQTQDYKGDYFIAYDKLGSFFVSFKDEIYKKIEFELNRRFANIIKNTFAGNLQRFQQNLTNGIDKTAEEIKKRMSSDPYKKGLLNQLSYRTVVRLGKIIEKTENRKVLDNIITNLSNISKTPGIDASLRELCGQKMEEAGEKVKKLSPPEPESPPEAAEDEPAVNEPKPEEVLTTPDPSELYKKEDIGSGQPYREYVRLGIQSGLTDSQSRELINKLVSMNILYKLGTAVEPVANPLRGITRKPSTSQQQAAGRKFIEEEKEKQTVIWQQNFGTQDINKIVNTEQFKALVQKLAESDNGEKNENYLENIKKFLTLIIQKGKLGFPYVVKDPSKPEFNKPSGSPEYTIGAPITKEIRRIQQLAGILKD